MPLEFLEGKTLSETFYILVVCDFFPFPLARAVVPKSHLGDLGHVGELGRRSHRWRRLAVAQPSTPSVAFCGLRVLPPLREGGKRLWKRGDLVHGV